MNSLDWINFEIAHPANMEKCLVWIDDGMDGEGRPVAAQFMRYSRMRYEFISDREEVISLHSIRHWLPLGRIPGPPLRGTSDPNAEPSETPG